MNKNNKEYSLMHFNPGRAADISKEILYYLCQLHTKEFSDTLSVETALTIGANLFQFMSSKSLSHI